MQGVTEFVSKDLALPSADRNVSAVPHRISSDTVTVETLEVVLEWKIPEFVAPRYLSSIYIGSLFLITELEKLDRDGFRGKRRRSRLGRCESAEGDVRCLST